MLLSSLLIIVGFALLVAGGELLLRGAVGLATLLRLTPAVIGLTVVAAGTSVPELAVSALAAWQGSPAITVGNVVGSNIFNVCCVLGLAAMVRPLRITGNIIRLEYPVMALVSLLCVVVCDDGRLNRLDATLLLAIYIWFTAYLVSLVRQQMHEHEIQAFQEEVQALGETDARPLGAWASAACIVGGLILLGSGAQVTVTGAVTLARLFELSEWVIGLTIVAAGTGLPEAVTSLVSSYRGRDDVAIGNVIGSNLFNILGILGLSSFLTPLSFPSDTIRSDNWWMLGVTLLLFPLLYTSRRISRWEGAVLLILYGVYLTVLLVWEG
jgi:cation:H+ antiporter